MAAGSGSVTVVRGGRVLDCRRHRAEPVDILVEDTRIRELGPPGLAAPEGAGEVDATGCLLMPGLVNAHTHGHGSLGKGMGDRWSLELLLNAGPWISGRRTLDDKYLAAKLNAAEMVRKGCTAAYDLYFEFPAPTHDGIDAVARGYADVGTRVVVAPMMADHTLFEAIPGLMQALPEDLRARVDDLKLAPAEQNIEACRAILHDWSHDRDQVRFALAPTIPLHCSDEFIVACRNLAAEYQVGLHMHLAESKVQAVSAIKRYGKTLTAHLAELDFLGPSFTAAHGVWLDTEDIARLADTGSSVAHNPGSNLRLGSGISPVRAMLDRGINVGIGTDGSNCSDNQNMFDSMRIAAFVSRVVSPEYTTWLETADVIDMATVGSAEALGLGDQIGRLEPGYYADIVFLDLTNLNFVPFNDPTNQIVFCEDSSAVKSVMIGGRMILDDGRFTTFDYLKMLADVEAAVDRLRSATADMRALSVKLEDVVGSYCVGLTRQPYHINRWCGQA